ncbi:MAG: Mu transposase C-terminal domain-containing protein [Actinobacteria bacterium]|nr:Mu transposase C-terminal domain-containing protein [Actinomycetota bacterium]MBU1945292.1 Mu transposase C-terminal domain-containing protein [Actinomycetota bacterium]MBU2686492.1 Mu transposase C-terminal domain-containing protein [Actinomycetota bacterium]
MKQQLRKALCDQCGELQVNWTVMILITAVFVGTGIALVAGLFGGEEGAFVTMPLGISFIALPFVLIGVLLLVMNAQKSGRERLEKYGIPGTARLVSINPTGSEFGVGSYGMKMEFEVTPSRGPAFKVKKSQFVNVSDMAAFQPGAVFPVLIDPKKRKRFIFDNRQQQAAGPSIPLQFQPMGPGTGTVAPGTQFFQGQQAAQLLAGLGLGGLAAGATNLSVNLDTDSSVTELQEALRAGGIAPDGQVQTVISSGGADLDSIQKIIDQSDYEVLAHGETAESTILEVTDLGLKVAGDNPAIQMLVEVHPAGRQPFKADVYGFANAASRHKLQVGRKLIVKFDPADITKVAIYHTGPDEGQPSPRVIE